MYHIYFVLLPALWMSVSLGTTQTSHLTVASSGRVANRFFLSNGVLKHLASGLPWFSNAVQWDSVKYCGISEERRCMYYLFTPQQEADRLAESQVFYHPIATAAQWHNRTNVGVRTKMEGYRYR